LKDHTEALLVEFDPTVITYQELLREWTRMHFPNHPSKRQYRSAVWYLKDPGPQHGLADKAVKEWMDAHPKETLYTSVQPAGRFYRAEEYHQHFMAEQGGYRFNS
jgi:peptide-methionine (S)-S-oxide reductase